MLFVENVHVFGGFLFNLVRLNLMVMANCHFEIDFPESVHELLATAKSSIKAAHGTLTGDTSEGKFTVPVGIGDIEGTYTLTEGVITIDITKKPLLISCKVIEAKVRSFLKPPNA
jgi:hypothetical protein